MQISVVENEKEWDSKALLCEGNSYLQSWKWGEMLVKSGQKVERILFEKNNSFVLAQVVVKSLPFGWQYFFCPKGSLFFGNDANEIFHEAVKYLASRGIIFLRFEPREIFKLNDFKIKKAKEINPSATLVLDISPTEEKLLSDMHSKTRYNLRVAQRSGLSVDNKKDFGCFWNLLQKTGARDNFILHPEKNYRSVMDSDAVEQITIRDAEGKPIASGGFIGFGERYYYLYGALDYEKRNLMAPYLLQWSAILRAKKLGYKYYDFFGIAPGGYIERQYTYDESHEYAGITKFKLGFGGVAKQSPGTFDLIISPTKYNIYGWLRKLRRLF